MPDLAGPFAPPGSVLALPEGVVLALSVAISLLLVLTPACAFAYARANFRVTRTERVLFGSAMTSSAVTALWMTILALFPALSQITVLQTTVLPFVTLFLWAWTILDFIRGVRVVGLRPRLWAVATIGLGALVVMVFLLPLLAL